MLNDVFPLRVEAVPAAHTSEWRADDSFPPRQTQAWQLIYVRSGTIEERCDDHRVLLRAGGLLFHQPGEVFAMTTVGEVPPETLRIDFYCTGAAMDRFRGTTLHAEPTEQHDLDWLANTANTVFDAAPVRGEPPIVKEDLPFGAMQQFIIHLENLLILLARRCRRTKRPVARVRRERRQYVLVEDARAYFAANLTRELKVDEVCAALGCTRTQLQQAFRVRLRRTAMEEFSACICWPPPARATAGARCLPRRGCRPDGVLLGRVFQPALPRRHRPHAVRLPPHPAGAARPAAKQATKRQTGIKNTYCRKPAERVKYKVKTDEPLI